MKKYVEIYKDIKEKIINSEYKSGQKLPSKRTMADKLGVSVITVCGAYGMLIDEGYVSARERSGYFVAELDTAQIGHSESRTPIEYLPLERADEGGDFEYSLWFKTIRRVISEHGRELFIKPESKGCAVLRNAIADYLYRSRAMSADPSRIVIGSGAEQLYEMVVKLLGRDKIYGIEYPSYAQIEAVYLGSGAEVERLPMGSEGIESAALTESRADVLHVTPHRSYPSDVSTSIMKKYEYLAWSEGKKYIVEDDFNSEFFKAGQSIETLYSINNERVIYINTFSKSLSSSMRIGYMILPEGLMERYRERLEMFSCSVPVLDQYILAEFISGGNFERHLNRARRRAALKENGT